MSTSTAGPVACEPRTAFVLAGGAALGGGGVGCRCGRCRGGRGRACRRR